MAEFDQIFASDPNNPQNVAENGVLSIYAPGTRSLLSLRTVTGDPLSNPLQLNGRGFGPAFMVDGYTEVAWEAVAPGEVFTGTFKSYKGVLEETIAAKTAAQAAVAAVPVRIQEAVASGDFRGPAGKDGANVATTRAAVAGELQDPTSPSRAVLSSAIGRPDTDISLIEDFGQASPKIVRIRSSSIPGTGVGPNAGRSMAIEVGDSRAKSMFDYRFPVKLVDGKWQIWDFRDGAPPESAYQSVIWGGVFHYWAQDQKDHSNPTDLHNHYSIVEARDDKGALHTIFDVPIGSSNDPTAIGTASHSIRTNRSDFVVRVGNPYDATLGRAYRLKVAASTENEKMVSFHNSTGGQGGTKDMSGVRWELGVLAGDAADFAIHRFTDVGFSAQRPFMFGHRESGKVTFGKKATYQGQVNSIYSADGVDGFYSYREAGTPGDTSAFTGHVGSVTNKAFRTLVGVTAAEKFRILGDGRHEWLNTDGSTRAALYAGAPSTVTTDGNIELAGASTRGIVRKSSDGSRWIETIGNAGERIVTKLA